MNKLLFVVFRNTVQRRSQVDSNVFLLQHEERPSDTEDEEDQSEEDNEMEKCPEASSTAGM